jgi:hypothetical protein
MTCHCAVSLAWDVGRKNYSLNASRKTIILPRTTTTNEPGPVGELSVFISFLLWHAARPDNVLLSLDRHYLRIQNLITLIGLLFLVLRDLLRLPRASVEEALRSSPNNW